ncbi:phosphatidate cytidylyltransferase [Mycoplasma putrefaciens]|uniref:Phosphatidate cytidylyltransferase n=1 Tax=Mycoplasma putrefaciens Mput9231 TaxID=1292033 RepID=M9WD67_9MOLU|nr:phosphatidate cytidylyltransferase [Mycoplasma putrefaciens]AGJ90766.1 Phosphatidate cytidylyltransferase [Mycoplasma putrefaciens Mput9231]
MNRTINQEQIKAKKPKSNLQLRVISSVFLVGFLAVYLTFPIIYNIGVNHRWNSNSLLTLNIISLLLSSLILFLSVRELLVAFKINFKKERLLIETFTVLLLWIPFIDKDKNTLVFSLIQNVKYWNLFVVLILVVYICIVCLILIKYFNKQKSEIAKILLITFIMVLALKSFNILGFYLWKPQDDKQVFLFFGFTSIIWIWLTIILTDTFAYLFGSRFGKHKLAPNISPKKSWEGAIAGFVCSVVFNLTWVLLLYFNQKTRIYAPFAGFFKLVFNDRIAPVVLFYVFFTILVSILSQLGDLLFSWIKRSIQIKDFSNLIPGHGGILDRLDSFYFVMSLSFIILIISLIASGI